MTTDIYVRHMGQVKTITTYGVLGLIQGVIPVLRGKKTVSTGVRTKAENKYFYIDNGPRKRVVVFSGGAAAHPEIGVGIESDLAVSEVKPLRMSVTMKTPEEEAEAVLAICGMIRAFGGPRVEIELREMAGPGIEISDLVEEYGTMGLDNFEEGGGFGERTVRESRGVSKDI